MKRFPSHPSAGEASQVAIANPAGSGISGRKAHAPATRQSNRSTPRLAPGCSPSHAP